MQFLFEYGLFLAKAVTLVVSILVVMSVIVALGQRQRGHEKGQLSIDKLNELYEDTHEHMLDAILDPEHRKAQHKENKKKHKQEQKEKKHDKSHAVKPRVFVLHFDGDIKASAVETLREEITAVLSAATADDEVVVLLESGGGMVHSYGLASSQLDRIKKHGVKLTVCVDRVAASGGYMMACVADKILAAPFAVMGSIGVLAQLPNFHRLLKKHDIDFEMLTAGEYKRTLTMFGENTDKDREKFIEDLEDTHRLFKDFVSAHRPQVNIEAVANGDVWYGSRTLENHLVDDLMTSDEYLCSKLKEADVFSVQYVFKKSLPEKLGFAISVVSDTLLLKWLNRANQSRFL